MVTFRIERLNKEFLRLIADILANRIKDEGVKEAVLTHVDCSRDLSCAKVYFTLLDDSKKKGVLSALEASSGQVRGLLGREMHIRQIPELRFVFDDSERKARSIDELIDRVIEEDNAKRR
ncbi:MAG: 30S ribosome-binding factor RbfA [Synergistaceae bacterium]|jgi:ribosome-binding factor A|nr:30S ribosome-binding factor RbfA [Synergistaceae bacterium]